MLFAYNIVKFVIGELKMKNNSKLILIIILTLSLFSLPYIAFCGTLSISGRVFNDKNCNGQKNGPDIGIGGVTITLNPGAITTTTAGDGSYSFSGLNAGTYTIKETDPAGYCSTTPNKIGVQLAKKNIKNQDFGDSKIAVSPPGESCCHE